MKPFSTLTPTDAKRLRYVLCDIDDTITTDGKLTADAYAALWRLHDAGLVIIPVTGRPAGWCDLIVRQWPVYAVVGENGAFVYYMRDGHKQVFTHPSVVADAAQRLAAVRDAALQGVPGCRVASDQFCRIYDVAIDFREDPPYLPFEDAERIRDICILMGAEAKVSSIHVNTWFGQYDKLSMTRLYLAEVLGERDIKDTVVFFGDSPNDEPMFEYFPHACAVANIRPFAHTLRHLPAYVTEGEGGAGFAEAAAHLLALRGEE